jgi:hypothetical protein
VEQNYKSTFKKGGANPLLKKWSKTINPLLKKVEQN